MNIVDMFKYIVGWVKQGVKAGLRIKGLRGKLASLILNPYPLILALILTPLILNPDFAHALKAPHASPNITLCSDCHSRTGAGFATITSQNVLCINAIGCHNPGGRAEKKSLSLLDASNRFGNLPAQSTARQSSHGWKIPNLNPDAGVTQTNKWGELGRGPQGNALNNKLLCTRCHRAHGEKAGYIIYDKFLRENPKGNYICFQCHAARQISNVRDPKPADKHYSHPVELNYSTVQASKPDFFEKVPLNPYPSNPSAAMKLFTSYSNQKGNVVCQTCHGPLHASDSNPYTLDNLSTYSKTGNYSTSEGNLLRRYPLKKSNDLCASCHKVQTHKTFMCNRCHTPHKKAGENNRYLVHENISTPNSGKKAVQFVSTSHMAQRYGDSNKMCQVCHTATKYHRNYSTVAAKRDHNYLGNDTYKFCPDCHSHTRGFSPEPFVSTACSTAGCHDDYFGQMNTSNKGYHHYLNNANVTNLASGSPYPVINPPVPLNGKSDQNRRCLQCHVEHMIFKPELNGHSNGRAFNLRTDISVLPNRTTAGINTDFVSKYGTYSTYLKNGLAPNGGICLSCHQNSQFKSYTQPDSTTRTPVINRTLFDDSPHQYEVVATFDNGATEFKANCSKCHVDNMNKSKQGAGNKFGPHFSNIRRINAAMINESNTGTATDGTTSTVIEDTGKTWTTDVWSSWPATILEGAGNGQKRKIRSNTATTFTVATAFSPATNNTSKYLIAVSRGIDSGTATSSNSTTIRDNTKTGASIWKTNYWKNRPVTIVSGTGYGQSRLILSNTTTSFIVSPGWSPTPDTTSTYSIGDPAEEEVCFRCHSEQTNPNAGIKKDYYGVKVFDNSKVLRMEGLFSGSGNQFRHRIDRYFGKHRADEGVNTPSGATANGWFDTAAGGLHTGCADCHNPHGNRKPGEDNGIATFGSISTLTHTGKTWSQDKWRGYTLRLMDGTGRGQDRMIVKNSANTLKVAATFVSAPGSDTYYIITPLGLPDKGNNLWNPNSGVWGVGATYSAAGVGTMTSPTFAKNTNLVAGTNKIYELCFKCHSEYGWGTSGTPFTIPDSIVATRVLTEEKTTDIAKEFNPNNLGHHPVVDIGNNQPIGNIGSVPQSLEGPFTATGGSTTTLNFTNTWTPNKYSGKCVEITGNTGSGQVRSITSHDTGGITGVDPAFSTAPDATSTFYVRNCSTFSGNWPRFTGGTITLTNGSSTATISGLANGIPSTTIAGWYIYAGALTGTPSQPPQLTTSGWFQITAIVTPGASDSGRNSVDVTITPTPTANYVAGAYALTAGLGNTFVPPYGPWSLMGCADCHDTDDSRDPSGPHASARNWMLRTLEAQIFPWFYGGLAAEGNSSTTDATLVKMIGYPDGNNSGWGASNMYKYTCLNCHRSDVYGTDIAGPTSGSAPSGSAFINFGWRNQGRIPHLPNMTAYWGGTGGGNIYGITCMNCHGGDNRASKAGTQYAALGGIHGSNLGLGSSGSSFRGRRLLNGATWNAVTRATTTSPVYCSYGTNDATSACSGGSGGTTWSSTAIYPYYSGSDVLMTTMTSAVAYNTSGGPGGVQTGDKVVIKFDGETNAPTINGGNVNIALALNGGRLWTDGSSNLGGTGQGVWSTTTYTNDTLTITLNTGASVLVGDTITPGGGIIQGLTGPITNTRTITGTFNVSLVSAVAMDTSNGGGGIQAGDKVVIRFDGSMLGTTVNNGNIASALSLNNGHFWTDGSGNLGGSGSGVWTSDGGNTNDTLTITLNNVTSSKPSVAKSDTISLGTTIKDSSNNTVNGSVMISGSLDSVLPGTGIVPAGWWKFNENAGSTAYDESTNNNDGTLTTATWTTTGKFGSSAIVFDGSSSRVNVSDSNSLDLTSAGSLEAFVKMGAANANKVILSKGTAYKLSLDGSGKIVFTWGATTITSTSTIDQTNWHHIVGTYSGGNLNLYIDGASAATQVTTGSSITANTTQLRIGTDGTNYFNGTIEEVVVYNVALTPSQVLLRYSPRITSIIASDTSGNGAGIQTGDQVIISLDGTTNGFIIDNSNIDTVLALNNSHLWRAGGTNVSGALWNNAGGKTNDTLTVTMNGNTDALVVASGDTITFNGSIKDALNRPIIDPKTISGGFDVPYGSVGFWAFNEATGTTATDSLNTNNATISDNISRVTAGYNGNALSFVGSNYANTATSPTNLNLTNLGAIELWTKKSANVLNQTYVSKGGTAYTLKEDATGKLVFNWGTDSITSTNAVPLNQWTHIVAVYDGTNLTLYTNGSPNGTKVSAINAVANTNAVFIGANAGLNKFYGLIDQVVIYNKALSPAEVRQRYKIRLDSAVATDTSSGGPGIQALDTVTIKFKGATNGAASGLTTANIDTLLNIGHSWGPVSSVGWTTATYSNDTLTVTLNTGATVGMGDTITLNGAILNGMGDPIVDSINISGTFGTTSPATPNATGYWKMEDSGATVTDATGNGNTGTITGATWTNSGRYGKALSFSGTQYVTTPASNTISGISSEITLEAWVYHTAVDTSVQRYLTMPGEKAVIRYSGATANPLQFYIKVNGSLYTLNPAGTLSPNTWYHVVGTYDGTTQKLYLNGNPTPIASQTVYGSLVTTSGGASISSSTAAEVMKGRLDEVAVYNRALSGTEVQDRYGAWLTTAVASDTTNNAKGIQAGDKVVITFNRPTNGETTVDTVIDTALALNGAPDTWKDTGGGNGITGATWNGPTSDTLTVTLRATGTPPTVKPGDTITLGWTIKDKVGRGLNDSIVISGNFGADANEPLGAVGNWKFNENTLTTANDATANGNTGTLSGSTIPSWATGRYSYGLSFNGSTAYVNVPDSNSLDLTSEGSVEAWVKMNGSNLGKYILSKGTSSYLLYINGTGNVVFAWGANVVFSSTAVLDQTRWHHIVGTYTGGSLNLYIDGASVATWSSTSIAANSAALKIGTDTTGANFFNGLIDEVVVYNKALTLTEVQQRYGTWLSSVVASDTTNNAKGIQAGDKVAIKFAAATNGAASGLTTGNIDTVLNIGHSWGSVSTVGWTNSPNTNDTLTITLNTGATVGIGDTIVLNGAIKDPLNRGISDSMPIGGNFGADANEPVGAVGNWKLNENSGTSTADATANGNTGTLSGSTIPTWATGRYSYGLSFNGSTAYVNVPDSNSIDLTTEGSVEAWVKMNGSNNNKVILSKWLTGTPATGYKLSVDATGKIVFTWGSTPITSTAALEQTQWHHIVGTYKAGNLNLYIDNALAATQVTTGSSITANATPLTIGSEGAANYFNGWIDEVVVYNKELALTSDVLARYGSWLSSAVATAVNTAPGIQATDKVVIMFNKATNASSPIIDNTNIATTLVLNGGHSWGTITNTQWSGAGNETLTVNLNTGATITVGDTITLGGNLIKDTLSRSIVDSMSIGGTFGTASNEPLGAVGNWKFNENTGTSTADATVNGNTGTLSGSTLPTWTTGRYSYGLSFNGSTAYVNVTDSNSLDLTTEGSVEAWVKMNGSNNNKVILSKGTAYKLSVDATGKIVFTWGATTITSTAALEQTKWHHIVGTYSGGNLNLYIDGVSAATQVTTGSSIAANATDFKVGTEGTNFWNGWIDEVVVYNKALLLSDAQTRYGTWPSTAVASDTTVIGMGLQAGDKVVITFSGTTNAGASGLSAANIDTALALSGGHSWKDGSGNVGIVWTSSSILTITLSGATSLPTIANGDTISLTGVGATILDGLNRPIVESVVMTGSFDIPGLAKSYWMFNEGSGSAANDSITATANNGTIVGATWTTGKFGNALNFNGSSNYVSFPSTDAAYALSGSYALEAWIKPAAFNEKGAIIFNGDASKFRYNFAVHSDGKLGFSFDPSGGIFGMVTNKSTGTLKLNEWNHVLVTRNGGLGTTATFYINGVASGTFADSHYATTSAIIKTGKTSDLDFDYFFNGAIDNVVIFNSYLSATDVKNRYRTWIKSARANDVGGAHGIQANDKVTITFDGPTNAPTINTGNIYGILTPSNSHTWGTITAAWNGPTNDTLTITLPATGATVATGDVITLDGVTIKDNLYRPLTDARVVEGSFSPTPAPGNVQGYWELNETSGATIVDGTANNNHGTIYNATRDAGGKLGYALSFNGTNAYAEMTNTSFTLTNAMSVEFWMKASGNAPGMVMVAGNAFAIKTAASNQVNPGIITGSGSGTFQGAGWTLGTNLFDNNWHHLVLTWDGTTQTFYVDGSSLGTNNAGSGLTLTTQTTMRLGNALTGSFYFTGIVDEVVIYNKVLSPAEVSSRYTNP